MGKGEVGRVKYNVSASEMKQRQNGSGETHSRNVTRVVEGSMAVMYAHYVVVFVGETRPRLIIYRVLGVR